MAKWFFESGHTEVEFKPRHMMVTVVRGLFENIEGTLEFDPDHPGTMSFETTIEAKTLWTGVQQRDDHLRSADFLDVRAFPDDRVQEHVGAARREPRLPGRRRPHAARRHEAHPLQVRYLGQWDTPWWEDGVNKGPKRRAGFIAHGRIDRYDFGVSGTTTLRTAASWSARRSSW